MDKSEEARGYGIAESLVTDGDLFEQASRDYGGLVHHRPYAVIPVRNAGDVVAAVRLGRELGLRCRARGAGHSTAGQAQAAGALIIDTRTMNGVHELSSDFVEVDAGITWRDLLATTLQHGLTPPVLTDYLDLTVGGTLSVGGIGGRSHRFGSQTDGVLELEVVTEASDLLICSRESNRTLFDAVRAGRGRRGIVTRARLPLVPAPARTCSRVLHYTDLGVFLHDQRAAMNLAGPDHLQGQAKWTNPGWRYELEVTQFDPLPGSDPVNGLSYVDIETELATYWEFANRLDDGERLLRSLGEWQAPHPWTNHFIPASASKRVVGQILNGLTIDDIGEHGTVLTYPLPRAMLATPQMAVPTESVNHLFALLRIAVPGRRVSVADMHSSNQVVTRLVADAGGTDYLGPID